MQQCNAAETHTEAGLSLERDGVEEAVDATEFRQIVGALRYLRNTRQNLAFRVGLISRFNMDRSRVPDLMAAKRILGYVKETTCYGI